MNVTFTRVQDLVARGEIRVSRHGFRELAAEDIVIDEILHFPMSLKDDVMPGLGSGIHVCVRDQVVDGRDKPGHDEVNVIGKCSSRHR